MDELSRLAAELPQAIEIGDIYAHYQPQFDVASRSIVAAETLARWNHPDFGMISPTVFIPLAEDLGVIAELGDHMIDLACESAAAWSQHGHRIEVAVNVSATQLKDPDFSRRLLDTVEAHRLDPRLLIVEVTESVEIIDITAVASRLDWLRSVGVTISVDDFGTGHSSVEQVLELRATELKIDQSLTQEETVASKTLLAAVVAFAHDQGLRVAAEGVETESQWQQICELGCDRAQGFLLGRPIEKSDFELLLT